MQERDKEFSKAIDEIVRGIEQSLKSQQEKKGNIFKRLGSIICPCNRS